MAVCRDCHVPQYAASVTTSLENGRALDASFAALWNARQPREGDVVASGSW